MTALGGGILVLTAAVLWCVVLIPGFIRRREYRTAERTSQKLQLTIRELARSSQESKEARMIADAEDALSREQILNSQQKREAAELKAELARARAEQAQAELRAKQAERARIAQERLAKLHSPAAKTARAVAALVFVVSLVGALIGVGTSIAGLGGTVFGVSAVGILLSFGALVVLAPGRVRVTNAASETASAPSAATAAAGTHAADEADETALAHDQEAEADVAAARAAARRQAQQEAAERMRHARALTRARSVAKVRENQTDSMLLGEARAQVRAAQDRVGTPPPKQQRERQDIESRLRDMGVVGDTSDGAVDVQAALRRRRSAS